MTNLQIITMKRHLIQESPLLINISFVKLNGTLQAFYFILSLDWLTEESTYFFSFFYAQNRRSFVASGLGKKARWDRTEIENRFSSFSENNVPPWCLSREL